jgi:hypothetical protein
LRRIFGGCFFLKNGFKNKPPQDFKNTPPKKDKVPPFAGPEKMRLNKKL